MPLKWNGIPRVKITTKTATTTVPAITAIAQKYHSTEHWTVSSIVTAARKEKKCE